MAQITDSARRVAQAPLNALDQLGGGLANLFFQLDLGLLELGVKRRFLDGLGSVVQDGDDPLRAVLVGSLRFADHDRWQTGI